MKKQQREEGRKKKMAFTHNGIFTIPPDNML